MVLSPQPRKNVCILKIVCRILLKTAGIFRQSKNKLNQGSFYFDTCLSSWLWFFRATSFALTESNSGVFTTR